MSKTAKSAAIRLRSAIPWRTTLSLISAQRLLNKLGWLSGDHSDERSAEESLLWLTNSREIPRSASARAFSASARNDNVGVFFLNVLSRAACGGSSRELIVIGMFVAPIPISSLLAAPVLAEGHFIFGMFSPESLVRPGFAVIPVVIVLVVAIVTLTLTD